MSDLFDPAMDRGDPSNRTTFDKLTSPYGESNWNDWQLQMRMMLAGYNIVYLLDGSTKRGFSTAVPPVASIVLNDKVKVCSMIAARVHPDNNAVIERNMSDPYQLFHALKDSHNNITAGGRFMLLREMMQTSVSDTDNMMTHLKTMDGLRVRLEAMTTGTITISDFYVAAMITSLPDSWQHVTQPLEVQPTVTPYDLNQTIRNEMVKRKTRKASIPVAAFVADAGSGSKDKEDRGKGKPSTHPTCDYCKRQHSGNCHKKAADERKKEMEELKSQVSSLMKSKKKAHAATIEELTDSDSSIEDVKKSAKTSRVRYARAASRSAPQPSDVVFHADSGCSDTMVTSTAAIKNTHRIHPCPVHLADDSVIKATKAGDVILPFADKAIPGLVVPGLSENLLSIGQLADNNVTSFFHKDGVDFFEGPVHMDGKCIGHGAREHGKYMVKRRFED